MNKLMVGGIGLGCVLVVGLLGMLHYKELTEISSLKNKGVRVSADSVNDALKNFFGGKNAGEFTQAVVKAAKDGVAEELGVLQRGIARINDRFNTPEKDERPATVSADASAEDESETSGAHPRFKDWETDKDGKVSVYVRHEGSVVIDADQKFPLVLRPVAPRDTSATPVTPEKKGPEKTVPKPTPAPTTGAPTKSAAAKKPTHIVCTNGVVHQLYEHEGAPSGWFLCFDGCGKPCRFKEDWYPTLQRQAGESRIVKSASPPDFRN